MNVLLLDQNEAFAKKFISAMTKVTGTQVSFCNNVDACREMLAKGSYQVVLIDGAFDSVNPRDFEGKHTAVAFFSNMRDTIKNTTTIYKYEGMKEIYEQLVQLHAAHTEREVKVSTDESGRIKNEILTFMPVGGGTGSSTVAMAAAIQFAKNDKVLYLNLEQMHAETVVFKAEKKKTITNLISTLDTNFQKEQAKLLFDDIIQSDEHFGNLQLIRGFTNMEDCESLTEAALTNIIELLKKCYEFRYIIIDADFGYSAFLKSLILHSDKLVFVSAGYEMANRKMEMMHRYLDVLSRDEILPRQFVVFNRYYGMNEEQEQKVANGMTIAGRFARFAGGTREKPQRLSTYSVIQEMMKTQDAFAELA
ncbi:MAG: AAA family ATPase [Oscillospiraceae bacterium]|nr:AAA family ATPase [Oscillospiraceae bacterium]